MKRPTLNDLDLSIGKRTRLHHLFYTNGPKNGTLLMLPYDQGLEHGPRDFFVNPDAADPAYQCRLALEGGFSGVVFQVGVAEKYMSSFAGQIPLVVKINGKTEIPSDDEAFSPCQASVEDAVRLGADAVGYTLYVGSPAQDRDFIQFGQVRRACDEYGMPLIVWAYPRGSAIEQHGGRESLYAVDYAARVACELGADVVKVNFPKNTPDPGKGTPPKPYDTLQLSTLEAFSRVVKTAGKTLVLVSGGAREDDVSLLQKARESMEGGATGLIFGRNVWQRTWDHSLAMAKQIHTIMKDFGA